jgi:hypothetical protein
MDGSNRVRLAVIWTMIIPGRRDRKCKGPEVREIFTGFKEISGVKEGS